MKIINAFLKLIAFIFALLFILSAPLTLFAFDLGRTVFNAPLVKQIVAEEVLHADPIPLALQWYTNQRTEVRQQTENPDPNREPSIFDILSFQELDDWQYIKNEVLPDEILIGWSNTAVDGTYEWLDSDYRVPQIVFDLEPFKKRAASVHGENAIKRIFSSLPPCKQDQIDDFLSRLAAVPSGTDVPYNVCHFPDPWFEDQYSDYLASLQETVSNIPNEFNLTEQLAQAAENPEGIGPEALKTQLLLIRKWLNLAPLIMFVLLILILIFGIRSLKTFGRWWGVPLTLGGLLALFPAITYRTLLTSILVSGPLSEVPALIQQNALHAILRLAEEVFKPMLYQSLALIGLGLVVFILTAILKRVRESKQVGNRLESVGE